MRMGGEELKWSLWLMGTLNASGSKLRQLWSQDLRMRDRKKQWLLSHKVVPNTSVIPKASFRSGNWLQFQLFLSFILCVWEFCPCVRLCTACVPGPGGGHKRAFNPLELEDTESYEPPCGSWEPSPLEEHPQCSFNH